MPVFQFNDHQICLNPEEVIIQSGGQQSQILLAQTPDGRWCYGYTWLVDTGHACAGAGYGQYRKTYPDRTSALLAAIEAGLKHAQHKALFPGQKPQANAFANVLRTLRGEQLQLSLF